MLARSQQDAVWDRTRAQLRLRSLLREFYPAALAVAAKLEDGLASGAAEFSFRVGSSRTGPVACLVTTTARTGSFVVDEGATSTS